VEYLVIAAVLALLVFLVHASLGAKEVKRVMPVLLVAFIARLVVHVVVMKSGVIRYGGDNDTYLARAVDIAAYWKREGFQFVTSDQIPALHSTALPGNLFGIIVYICGDRASLACTAVVAFIACWLCIIMYKFARRIGADEPAAFRLLVVVAFLPSFVVHTSDTFKDGINAFLVMACLALTVSSMQRLDVRKLLMIGPLLWALWYVRPYMVFMCGLPLILGISSIRRKFVALSAASVVIVVFLAGGGDVLFTAMQEQLQSGQSEIVRNANASGGSGVLFEDSGNAWDALLPKLLYTLLAPFPWMEGSLELQLGKIDTLLWYFLLYNAVRGCRRLWSYDRTLLFVLLLFIIPGTIAYATTMANVGLMFRLRIPIVLVASLLAAIAWTKGRQRERQPLRSLMPGRAGSSGTRGGSRTFQPVPGAPGHTLAPSQVEIGSVSRPS
jgi:hypothetical protein